jgi:uncharacterized membrane protein
MGYMPGQKKKRLGKALVVVGGFLLINGIIWPIQNPEIFHSEALLADLVFLKLGAGLLTYGFVVWSQGSKDFKSGMQGHKASLQMTPRLNGFSLSLKF